MSPTQATWAVAVSTPTPGTVRRCCASGIWRTRVASVVRTDAAFTSSPADLLQQQQRLPQEGGHGLLGEGYPRGAGDMAGAERNHLPQLAQVPAQGIDPGGTRLHVALADAVQGHHRLLLDGLDRDGGERGVADRFQECGGIGPVDPMVPPPPPARIPQSGYGAPRRAAADMRPDGAGYVASPPKRGMRSPKSATSLGQARSSEATCGSNSLDS